MEHSHNHDHHHSHDHHSAVTNIATSSIAPTTADQIINGGGGDLAHDHGSSSAHATHEGMMSMTFHGGFKETVLFDWWKFESVGGLLGSIFAIFIIAILYEGLKYYRDFLFWRTCNNLQYRAVQPPEEKASPSDEPRVVQMVGGVYHKQQPTMCSKFHLWQTFLHAVQVTVSYLLMLIFMTYNSWLCLAVVAGAACGNFLFGWKKSIVVDVTEHCH